MNLANRRAVSVAALMLIASALAWIAHPTFEALSTAPKFDLQTMIPSSFAEWKADDQSPTLIVNPQQEALLAAIYSQTLSRTYYNAEGYRIMLSVAYGSDQRKANQVHKPEVCYPAQGFSLESLSSEKFSFGKSWIPLTRVVTSLGQRHEPVTYWTIIADQPVTGAIQRKRIELGYTLTGRIPDGMLVRVSSIDADTVNAYRMQDIFITRILEALTPEARKRVGGSANDDR
jgi:EpsI family protein